MWYGQRSVTEHRTMGEDKTVTFETRHEAWVALIKLIIEEMIGYYDDRYHLIRLHTIVNELLFDESLDYAESGTLRFGLVKC